MISPLPQCFQSQAEQLYLCQLSVSDSINGLRLLVEAAVEGQLEIKNHANRPFEDSDEEKDFTSPILTRCVKPAEVNYTAYVKL